MSEIDFHKYLGDYFAEVFGVESADVNPDANLFEMGLDSLRSLELACVISSELSIDLNIARFRECRTINEIASTLGKATHG
jgi:acyl carrier protein